MEMKTLTWQRQKPVHVINDQYAAGFYFFNRMQCTKVTMPAIDQAKVQALIGELLEYTDIPRCPAIPVLRLRIKINQINFIA